MRKSQAELNRHLAATRARAVLGLKSLRNLQAFFRRADQQEKYQAYNHRMLGNVLWKTAQNPVRGRVPLHKVAL